jgi:hypothetical protein
MDKRDLAGVKNVQDSLQFSRLPDFHRRTPFSYVKNTPGSVTAATWAASLTHPDQLGVRGLSITERLACANSIPQA